MKARFFLAWFLAAGVLNAAPLNPNNILVSIGTVTAGNQSATDHDLVYEYTPDGQLVQIIPFNYNNRPYNWGPDYLRHIVVDPYGYIDAFNGTVTPFLTRYDPSAGSFSHTPFPNWRIVNNVTYGGIAAYQNFLYVGNFNGIVRFDSANHTADLFRVESGVLGLNVGLDHRLYALCELYAASGGATDILVFDSVTMEFLKDIPIPVDIALQDNIRGVAVDQSGSAYIVGLHRALIYKLDGNGALVAQGQTGFAYMTNVNIDESGRIIIGEQDGHVIITEPTITHFSSFAAVAQTGFSGAWPTFVSFARTVPAPIGPVPAPAATPAPTPTPVPAHNILVSSGVPSAVNGLPRSLNTVWEFNAAGALLQSIPFNYNGGAYPSAECLRGIAVDKDGVLDAFNGTYAPLLTRWNPGPASFTNSTVAGWSTDQFQAWGGIATYQNFVYLTDEAAAADGSDRVAGLLQVDLTNGNWVRFSDGINFVDVTMGLDGLLYGLFRGGSTATDWRAATDINVYDPVSLVLLRHIALPIDLVQEDEVRSLAVDQLGRIFLCSYFGVVYQLDTDGVLQDEQSSGYFDLTSLAVDETGRLVVTDAEGHFITGFTSLKWNDMQSFDAFPASTGAFWTTHIAFAPLTFPIVNAAPAPTPIPGPFVLNTSQSGGTVSKFPDRLNYPYLSRVGLVATPATGYKFTGWGAGVRYQWALINPLIVTMDGDQNITATFALILPTAAAPVISPGPGTYQRSVSVTLSDTTPGAVIHYTTDGTPPTSSSPVYNPPTGRGRKKGGTVIKLTVSATVKAIAIATGYNDSPVSQASYTVTPKRGH